MRRIYQLTQCVCGKTFLPKSRSNKLHPSEHTKFCSKKCADKNGIRIPAELRKGYNPNRSEDLIARKTSEYVGWVKSVLLRDNFTCQKCNKHGGDLNAHHLYSFKDYPQFRYELENGVTLCVVCHTKVHGFRENQFVKIEILKDEMASLEKCRELRENLKANLAHGNPQPSFTRKSVEGSETNGEIYRKIDFICPVCGKHELIPPSIAKTQKFCSRVCVYKGSSYFSKKLADTSTAPVRDEIVRTV